MNKILHHISCNLNAMGPIFASNYTMNLVSLIV
jgi:hypothetical protein